MKEIKLNVLHKNIEQRIQTYTYYTGEARKEAGLPQRLAAQIQASSDDSAQLQDHIGSAIDELANLISRYFTNCDIEEKTDADGNKIYQFTLSSPALLPDTVPKQIERCAESYIVKRVLQQWLQQHRPEEAMIPASEAQTLVMQLRELFTLRQRPTIKQENSNNPIDI